MAWKSKYFKQLRREKSLEKFKITPLKRQMAIYDMESYFIYNCQAEISNGLRKIHGLRQRKLARLKDKNSSIYGQLDSMYGVSADQAAMEREPANVKRLQKKISSWQREFLGESR